MECHFYRISSEFQTIVFLFNYNYSTETIFCRDISLLTLQIKKNTKIELYSQNLIKNT